MRDIALLVLWLATALLLCAGEVWSASGSVVLTWTAPGDNGPVGWASKYDIRYSTSPITDANWASATKVANPPIPKPARNRELFKVTGLQFATTYYFAMKTADSRPNWSPLSNNAIKTTCPGVCTGHNGNLNNSADGRVDLADLTLLTLLFTNPAAAANYQYCPEMANVNGSSDNLVDLADLAQLVANLTSGTPIAPCPK